MEMNAETADSNPVQDMDVSVAGSYVTTIISV
jgi:hypothetical protein